MRSWWGPGFGEVFSQASLQQEARDVGERVPKVLRLRHGGVVKNAPTWFTIHNLQPFVPSCRYHLVDTGRSIKTVHTWYSEKYHFRACVPHKVRGAAALAGVISSLVSIVGLYQLHGGWFHDLRATPVRPDGLLEDISWPNNGTGRKIQQVPHDRARVHTCLLRPRSPAGQGAWIRGGPGEDEQVL